MIISIFKTMPTVDKIKTVGTLIPIFYNNIQSYKLAASFYLIEPFLILKNKNTKIDKINAGCIFVNTFTSIYLIPVNKEIIFLWSIMRTSLLLIINSLKFYNHSNINENSLIPILQVHMSSLYYYNIFLLITKILSQKIILKKKLKIILALYSLYHSLNYNYFNTVQLFNL